MTNQERALRLHNAANRATRDALQWARQPNGEGLAQLRRNDARGLRRLATEALRAPA